MTLVALGSGLLPIGANAARFQPANTWALTVGLTEWKDPRLGTFEKVDQGDAKLVEALDALGVPKSQNLFLNDKNATKLRIETSLHDLVTRS